MYIHSGHRTGGIFLGRSREDSGLGHGSQANLVVGPVKDGEVLADEDVAQDPELSGGGGEVHALEAAGTALLALEKGRMRRNGTQGQQGQALARD